MKCMSCCKESLTETFAPVCFDFCLLQFIPLTCTDNPPLKYMQKEFPLAMKDTVIWGSAVMLLFMHSSLKVKS